MNALPVADPMGAITAPSGRALDFATRYSGARLFRAVR
jgi:hypothetical protein